MICPKNFLKFLKKKNIDFYTGVPDSVLKNFTENLSEKKNYIMANEGLSVSLGIGYYLKTKKIPLIYFQNSGLGNTINPLISIAHKNIYSIPMVLLIGWRGAPNIKDEPQHTQQGKNTISFLKNIGIKSVILTKNQNFSKLGRTIDLAKIRSEPIAILVKKNIFSKTNKKIFIKNSHSLQRSEVIKFILNQISKKTIIFSSTGYISRELNHHIKLKKNNKIRAFFNVGGMGHTSSLALGYSINSKDKIICLDGDGALMMHMGSIANIGTFSKKNFIHILLNNGTHESVGGQTTNSFTINFEKLTQSVNYKSYHSIKSEKDLEKKLPKLIKKDGPSFCEIFIQNKSIKNLGRPKDFNNLKKLFIK
jgi:phosphonopyruvate decarboxylase